MDKNLRLRGAILLSCLALSAALLLSRCASQPNLMQIADKRSQITQAGFEFFPTGMESEDISDYNGCGFRLISSQMSFIDANGDGHCETVQGAGDAIYITMNTDRGQIIEGTYLCGGDKGGNHFTLRAVINAENSTDPTGKDAIEYFGATGTMQVKCKKYLCEITLDCNTDGDATQSKHITAHYKGLLTPVAIH